MASSVQMRSPSYSTPFNNEAPAIMPAACDAAVTHVAWIAYDCCCYCCCSSTPNSCVASCLSSPCLCLLPPYCQHRYAHTADHNTTDPGPHFPLAAWPLQQPSHINTSHHPHTAKNLQNESRQKISILKS
jgi:hypothetical protein